MDRHPKNTSCNNHEHEKSKKQNHILFFLSLCFASPLHFQMLLHLSGTPSAKTLLSLKYIYYLGISAFTPRQKTSYL